MGAGWAAHGLGKLLEKQGKADDAIAAYRQGIELGDGGAASNLGILLAEQGKSDEAEKMFRLAEDLGYSS